MSPLSAPTIRQALASFEGMIISVSYDRAYLKEVCDIVYELTNDGLHEKSSNKNFFSLIFVRSMSHSHSH